MKRFFCLLCIFVLIPLFAFADRVALSEHYALFISGDAGMAGKGSLFEFDSFSADLYILDDGEKGYFCTSKCFSGLFITSGMVSVTLTDQDGVLYIVDNNGNYYTAIRDENGADLWIDIEGYTFRMRPVQDLSYFEDVK